jgi:hypothetical protein
MRILSALMGASLLVEIMGWPAPRPVLADAVVTTCTEAGLRAAIAAGGTITFNCGAPVTIVLASPITFTANTVLDGGGTVTLSGNNASGLLVSNDNLTLTLRNLTLINGRSADQGAALRAGFWTTLTIEAVTFSGHVSTRDTAQCDGGGAVFIGGGSTAAIRNSTFRDNQANNGGAINSLRTDLTVLDSRFENNRAVHTARMDTFGDCGGGGAVYIDGANSFNKPSTVTLRGNTFTGNSANNHGGAVFIGVYQNETVTVEASTFRANRNTVNTLGQAGTGGAIWYGAGDPSQTVNALTVNASTFIDNHADTQGGGLWTSAGARLTNVTFSGNEALNPAVSDTSDWRRGNGGALVGANRVEINNSTFVGNRAGFNGGAIAGSGTSPTSPIVIRNSLIVNNTGGNVWGIQQQCTSALTDGGNSLQWPNKTTGNWNDYNCLTTIAAVNPATTLGQLADNGGPVPTIALLPGSPALNAGNAATCASVDARGTPRPQGADCDLGAYERVASLAVAPSVFQVGVARPLSVWGEGFTTGQAVTWNGTALTTTFVSATQLSASVSASLLGAPGTASVAVSGSPLPAVTVQVWPRLEQLLLPMVRR